MRQTYETIKEWVNAAPGLNLARRWRLWWGLATALLLAGPVSADITSIITIPGGSTGQVQFKGSNGLFVGTSTFRFEPSSSTLYIQKLLFTGDGSIQTTAGGGGGSDSLGSHVATKTLTMSGFDITNVSTLTVLMQPTQSVGIHVDGRTSSGTAVNSYGVLIEKDGAGIADDSTGNNVIGLYVDTQYDNRVEGTIPDANVGATGIYAIVQSNHADTADHQDGSQIYTGGIFNASHSGSHSGLNQDFTFTGIEATNLNGVTFNNVSGNYSTTAYGAKLLTQLNNGLTAGTLTANNYGAHITVNGTTVGTMNSYGLYIDAVTGGTSYGVYSVPDVTSYLRGNLWINELSGSGMIEVESDGSSVISGIFRGAAGQSAPILTVEDSVGTDVLNVTNSRTEFNNSIFMSASAGALTMGAFGLSNNESINFDLNSTANTLGIQSATGINLISATGIAYRGTRFQSIDDGGLYFGNAFPDVEFQFDTNETNDTLKIGTTLPGNSNNSGVIMFTEQADINTNYGITASTYPRIRLQSPNASSLSDYIDIGHDETNAKINVGRGFFDIGTATINAQAVRFPDGTVQVTSATTGSGNAILNQNTLQAGSTAYPQYTYVGSSAVVYGSLDVGNEYGTEAYYKMPAAGFPWPVMVLGSNDPIGSQTYGVAHVLQGNTHFSMTSDLFNGFAVGLSSDSSSLATVNRLNIDRTSGEMRLSDHSGNRMLGIMPSSSTQHVPALFMSTMVVHGDEIHRATVTFTSAIDVSSSVFMDSRYNVYTASNIPVPTYNYQQFMLPYAQSGLIGQLQNFRTIKGYNNAVSGGVGISGMKYIQEMDRLVEVDNNDLSIRMFAAGNSPFSAAFGTQVASITLTGFTDPESVDIVSIIRNSSGTIREIVFSVSEEQSNQIKLFVWPATATTHIASSVSTLILSPRNMPAPSATVGQESICWDERRIGWHTFKQDTPFDYRFVPFDGTFNPIGVEKWDAETLYSALMPAMNDCDYDPVTDSIVIIGDQTSSASANQDILIVDPDSGIRKDYWDNFPTALNLNVAAFAQSEGIAISWPNLYITSEGNELLWLQLDSGMHGLPVQGRVMVGSTTADTGSVFGVTASSAAPIAIFRSLVAQTTSHWGVQDLNQRYMIRVSSNGYARAAIGTTTVDGNLTCVFDVKYASASNLANTQTELFGSTVPGGTFFEEGDSIEFKAYGGFGAGASANKRIIVAFGVTGSSVAFDTDELSLASEGWEIEGTITRVGTAAQRVFVRGSSAGSGFTNSRTTLSQNSLGNNLFRISGQGSDAGDVTLDYAIIKYIPGTTP